MKTYTIEINESYTRVVTVELDDDSDINDALSEVRDNYYNERIILDSDDFDDVDFNEVNED
jgi:hypothetical protein